MLKIMKYSDYIFPRQICTFFLIQILQYLPIYFQKQGKVPQGNFHSAPKVFICTKNLCSMLCTSAHNFKSMPVLEIQLSSCDNITDLMKLRPNFCPKVSEQPSPRILGFFRARARALFRSSWSDRARAVTRAQLLKKI